MLVLPRELVAWALALFEAPPKALLLREASLLETCRLPTLFPPLLARFGFDLLGRLVAFALGGFAALAPRLFALVWGRLPACCRAFACRVDIESPRVVPPYLFAVALLE